MSEIADLVQDLVQTEGDYSTAIPGLTFHRRNAPTQPLHCIYNLSVAITAQGAKQVLQGDKVLNVEAGQAMLITVDLPVVAYVTRATIRKPFLGLVLLLDVHSILQMASEMNLPGPPRDTAYQAISCERVDGPLSDAFVRLIQLMKEPELVSHLAPIIRKEITIRLLTGPHGVHLLHLVAAGTPGEQVTKVIAWLKQNFTRSLDVNELAARAHMSPSTFRRHFRTITGVSPLQYQKQLRLQEARQLMLNENLNASYACGLVGFESASQFNREYRRLFGAPPQRDVKRLRAS